MIWHWLFFGYNVKPHACPAELRPAVIADLARRGYPIEKDEPLESLNIDQPGMVSMARPWEVFDLAGLHLEIPSEDVGTFIWQLEALKPRDDIAGGYKLHAWMRCLCLTPALRDELLALLHARHVEADTRSRVFYAEHESPAEVLKRANRTNLDCGGRTMAEFKAKKGEA